MPMEVIEILVSLPKVTSLDLSLQPIVVEGVYIKYFLVHKYLVILAIHLQHVGLHLGCIFNVHNVQIARQ